MLKFQSRKLKKTEKKIVKKWSHDREMKQNKTLLCNFFYFRTINWKLLIKFIYFSTTYHQNFNQKIKFSLNVLLPRYLEKYFLRNTRAATSHFLVEFLSVKILFRLLSIFDFDSKISNHHKQIIIIMDTTAHFC